MEQYTALLLLLLSGIPRSRQLVLGGAKTCCVQKCSELIIYAGTDLQTVSLGDSGDTNTGKMTLIISQAGTNAMFYPFWWGLLDVG